MKKIIGLSFHFNENYFAAIRPLNLIISKTTIIISSFLLAGIVFSGCKKEENSKTFVDGFKNKKIHAALFEGNVVNDYGLSAKTTYELQQARSATTRYRDIKNAIIDGYSLINKNAPGSEHRFINTKLLNGSFDIRKPAILVYDGLDKRHPELVAVEYAVSLNDPRPEGFTGSDDVWKDDPDFPFWLLHVWVWAYNPDGAFNWNNPLIQLD